MGDHGMGSLVRDREAMALGFDISVDKLAGTERFEEQEDYFTLTAARMRGQLASEKHLGLIHHFEPTADYPRESGEYLLPDAALRQPEGLTPPQTLVFNSVLESTGAGRTAIGKSDGREVLSYGRQICHS